MRILKFIAVKVLVKQLPEILAYIFTKVLTWTLKNHPEKSAKVMETSRDISLALSKSVEFAKDGIISKEEIKKAKELWKEVFI